MTLLAKPDKANGNRPTTRMMQSFLVRLTVVVIVLLFFQTAFAQTVPEKKKGWHLLDQQKDGYLGIGLDQAYALLKGKKSRTVIVAVIDSGIDTLQEDLLPVLWRNPREIPGNGIDDDHNGYPDDVYGWNFCGSPSGVNLARNTHEIARVYHHWKADFEGKKAGDIPASQQFLYLQWKKADSIIEANYADALKELPDITRFQEILQQTSKTICESLKVSVFSVRTLDEPALQSERRAVQVWRTLFEQTTDSTITQSMILDDIARYKDQLLAKKLRKEQSPEDFRGALVKDNYTDINDRFYGNNNLKEGSGNHGTSVAGIIAAVRNNGIGMDGIADNVRIMAIRAVPGGDEHDKDVALAIRYAVDNGASIINMSFGKPVSPYKQFVDEAVKYAASKGVLLIHGSGNDGADIDLHMFYPSPLYIDGTVADNFLTVGASGDPSTGSISAPFSNYSAKWVDIFAPGVFIYTTTINNGYEAADGTSFAAPVATGVAALLKSYFPHLKPAEIIDILVKSGTPVTEYVSLPGEPDKKVPFTDLCRSGKIINAAEAVKMAMKQGKQ